MTTGTDASFPAWLWDLLPKRRRPATRRPDASRTIRPESRGQSVPRKHRSQRYEALVRLMKRRYGIRVRRWRSSTTGCAWEVRYADGTLSRLIEAPYPRGPVSAAVFLHEVGHHAIGFYRYKPRCLEEYMAWRWALEAMRANGITITRRVRRRIDEHLRYAVAKARRRGLKRLPAELAAYGDRSPPIADDRD